MKTLIRNGKLYTVTGGVIEKGDILIRDGKIEYAGSTLEYDVDAKVVEAGGKTVTPGLIDAHTHISVSVEPRAKIDYTDSNEITNPNTAFIRAIDALNPRDQGVSDARRAGFTTCYTQPGSANVIGGTGVCFKPKDVRTVLEMVIPGSEQMKMALGENVRNCYGKDKKTPMTRMGIGGLLREALFDAQAYAKKKLSGKDYIPNFRLEALVPVVTGDMKCRIHCHRSDDIVTAVRISEEFGLDFALEHVTEGYMVKEFLSEHGVTCVVGPLTIAPYKAELWNCTLRNPGLMDEAGVNVCLTEDKGTGTRWLPMNIGLCIKHGMRYQSALEAVTIRPARLLGIAHRTGSIEAGKDADLAIFDGDPFCNYTTCTHTVIDGEIYENTDE